ncbi:MAG: EpsI family protein [Burkholderiales bacterium]|nr:EpsI family protein [Burkholderiales bacterium]MDE2433951.1 EpsI family protein [Burkholderiales bacterium]HET8694396.1 EpsI family protein [Aquabacterium sp.]
MRLHDGIKRLTWPVVLGVMLMMAAVVAGLVLRPTHFWADAQGQLNLEQMVPKQFGRWHLLEVQKLQVVDPTVEETLKTLYSQTLNRMYEDDQGNLIMVSLAYGANQSSWNTAAHRPEFCYSGQGFEVAPKGIRDIELSNHGIEAVNFVGTRQDRVEAVTYWVTLADSVALPGWRRKLQQLKYGLQGYIVDGMLVRVSSLGSNGAVQFGIQEQFVKDLERAMSPGIRPRFFGH